MVTMRMEGSLSSPATLGARPARAKTRRDQALGLMLFGPQ
jgi:hypothetical protein